ncbi:2-dehydro-3-deoxy-D-gluconate 5-dehydrogenase KduD [Paenibacillus aurantius]|uniref:2-dehydro-3-deoxy-D-gluconate 5-dehydrogenase KduD n=1 Tax=Paenibacillus aurantius TaxID=2918900 RepID=A0AA96LJ74_9BACL|nr:2-dehydro-3-deoxy-D-gluconate 5-dehydrogenase KduD [Paenibacillus aurantius]WJH32595.1 2-dehydro-3-deoxy-D-gluconate 5-dehydrogenase KduD [Paenibacillus sp. CC-CFT747]WNQ13036.1 2-dehydro-3-deoxy-D-gluconate 5-dehydrogenase KduD [Paenibacillus aurantius]
MKLFDLTGRTAVVTGAGRGLGQGLAVGLAEAGADVVLVTNGSSAEETKAQVEALGRRAHAIQADVSDESKLEEIVRGTLDRFGRIDILVNNAGIIRRTPAAEHSSKDWHDVLDVNLNSVYFLCQLAGREMIKQGSGKIINIASMLSFQGGINVPGYTASKHAVAGLTKALANEWAGKGVNVNAIAPGYMATDNTEALRNDPNRSQQILERIPAGRWGTIDDMKGPAVFLASEAGAYMNGHILCVDGGWMAR